MIHNCKSGEIVKMPAILAGVLELYLPKSWLVSHLKKRMPLRTDP